MLARPYYPLVIAAVVAAVISLVSPAALAATVSVPGNFATIGEAIANASAGDTIYVDSGTYHENLVIGKTLLIIGRGTGGSMPTIGVSSGTGITVAADNVVVQRMRVQGGATGILVKDCSKVNIMECIVTGNKTAGLWTRSSSHLRLNRCVPGGRGGWVLY